MHSPERLARTAGLLYLCVGIFGGFSEGFVDPRMYVCYLLDLLAAFLVPALGRTIHAFVVIPSAVAEITMVFYLLVVGVKTAKPIEPRPAAA